MGNIIRFFKGPDDKRGTSVSIESEEKIGEGVFGEVSKVTADVNGRFRRVFAMKHFKKPEPDDKLDQVHRIHKLGDRDSGLHALTMHKLVKSLGLPTWATYRLSEDHTKALMTFHGADDDTFIVQSTPPSQEDNRYSDGAVTLFEEKVPHIENFTQLVGRTIRQIQSANGAVHLSMDSFLYEYNRTSNELSIIVGDFDCVDDFMRTEDTYYGFASKEGSDNETFVPVDHESGPTIKTRMNIYNFLRSLEIFTRTYVADDARGEYVDAIIKARHLYT